MRFDLLSLFPEAFAGPLDVSVLKKAREKGLVEINLVDIRSYSTDKHRRVDDRPYGGGPGMVMTPQPCVDAIRSLKEEGTRVIALSPRGKKLTAAKCKELAELHHLILLCGHYEGIDQRVIDLEVDEEVSIGDYVLTSGVLPAMVLVDGVSRFVPGVLGNDESPFEEEARQTPQYTRPEVFEGQTVPEVLLSGDHRAIEFWKQGEQREPITTH